PIASRSQAGGATVWGGQGELGDRAIRRNPPDDGALREPDIPIRADRDVDRGPGLTRNRELGHLALHRDSSDPVALRLPSVHRPGQLDEPHTAVGTGGDVAGA